MENYLGCILKGPIPLFTNFPYYFFDIWFGVFFSYLGGLFSFFLSKRKGYNGIPFAIAGTFFWAYTIIAIGFLKFKNLNENSDSDA